MEKRVSGILISLGLGLAVATSIEEGVAFIQANRLAQFQYPRPTADAVNAATSTIENSQRSHLEAIYSKQIRAYNASEDITSLEHAASIIGTDNAQKAEQDRYLSGFNSDRILLRASLGGTAGMLIIGGIGFAALPVVRRTSRRRP